MSERMEALYERARELPPDARAGFLAEACAGDAQLEAELRSLLEHAQPAEAFFASLAGAVPTTSGLRIGRYRLLGVLGSGGMGTVYRAHDTSLDRDVALKFLPSHLSALPEARERLLVEARAAAALEHQNVCSVHEVGETADGRMFIAMACYEGETLRERLGRAPLSTEQAIAIAAQLARGLSAAHARGIVHRDVKPGNVMLCSDGTVRLLDFGLAKLTDVALTGPGVTPGTVAYMSPEQARGDPVDARTDLWSLGVVLYEMVAGQRPFRGDNDRAVLQAIVHEQPEPLRSRRPETPDWLAGVVARLLEKEPARRYGTAAELLHDLESTPPAGPPPAWRRSHGRRAAAVTGAVVLAVLAGLSLARRDGPPEVPTAPRASPAIAVLPFTVRGEGLDLWREGLVDLLSLGLDGAGGLRAIHSRTVLSRWNEEIGEGEMADLPRTLEVARRTGARYAVIGSAVAAGPRLRLVADLYDLATGRSSGQAQVEGSPDSVLPLVDRLGVQAVGVILEQDSAEMAGTDLAGVTTSSLTALKAYLEGEAHFRRSEFRRASEAWQRAVRADSNFALAYLGLGETYGWDENRNIERAEEAWARAIRLSDRLPPREKAVVQATLLSRSGTAEGLRAIERIVREYPDDAGAWFALGEAYYHMPHARRGPEEIERAFRQAAELQPAIAPYRAHLLDLAFDWRPDSARVGREVAIYERIARGTIRARAGRLAFDLTFAEPGTRERARAALDTLEQGLGFQTYMLLSHPKFATAREAVYSAVQGRVDPSSRRLLLLLQFMNLALEDGRVRDALVLTDDPAATSNLRYCGPLNLATYGLPVPRRLLEERLAMRRRDPASMSDPVWVTCAAAYAAERARWNDHAALLSHARAAAASARASGDSAGAQTWDRALSEAEAHGLWRQGRGQEALGSFEQALTSDALGWWALSNVARVELELGRLDLAERTFRTLWGWGAAPARMQLARLLERSGRTAEAREAYGDVVFAWRDADPEVKPWIDEAREAIARLSDSAS